MTDKHEKREIGIFSSFAAVCPLKIDISSIEKRDRPDPDIFCQTSEGPRAFEMVELVDRERVARPIGDQMEMMDALRDASQELPEAEAKVLSGVWAQVNTRPDLSLRRRKQIAKDVIKEMVRRGEGFMEKFSLNDGEREVAAIEVKRLDWIDKPHFHVPAGGALDPVPLDAVAAKFAKDYQSTAPIDLLAYYDRQHAPLEEQIAELAKFIQGNMNGSPFQRFWIFNTYDKKIWF